MNYTVVNKWNDMDFGGSAMVGTINISREELIAKLGEPIEVNGPRIKERWLIKFENGVVGTIFQDDKCTENEWCVGGFGQYNKKTKENYSLKAVKELLNA